MVADLNLLLAAELNLLLVAELNLLLVAELNLLLVDSETEDCSELLSRSLLMLHSLLPMTSPAIK